MMQNAGDFAEPGSGAIAVLHDLTLTAMFADRIAMRSGGHILAAGPITTVMTSQTLSLAYGCPPERGLAPPPSCFPTRPAP